MPTVVLYLPMVLAIIGIAYGAKLAMSIFKRDEGTDRMKEISLAIREGANAYLKRQFATVAIFVALLLVPIYAVLGQSVAIAFIVGAGSSGLAGYFGMYIAVRSNSRAAKASRVG